MVTAAGTTGAVDGTTGVIELSTAGDMTCRYQHMKKGFAIILLTSAVGCHCGGFFLVCLSILRDDFWKTHSAEKECW